MAGVKRWMRPEYRLQKREYDRKYKLMKDWGLTLSEWRELFKSQDCKCAICGSTNHKGSNWHIDHNHETGMFRGILCHHCNRGMGYLQDSVDILQNAIAYLKETDLG